MSERISASEFARRESCDEKQVRRAINHGLLKRGSDKLLDASQVGNGWRRLDTRTRRKDSDKPKSELSEPTSEQGQQVIADGSMLSRADAERVKENMLAKLRQLEFDQRSGAVVGVEDVAKVVREQYAKVRTRLLAIPSECAQRVLQVKTAPEVQAMMQEAIAEALEELTGVSAAA